MAVLSLRRRGKTCSEMGTRGTFCGNRYRPALETLEERLPPGDAVLGGILTGFWIGTGLASGERDVFQEPVTASDLLYRVADEAGWVETRATERPAHSAPGAGVLQEKSSGSITPQGAGDREVFGVRSFAEEVGGSLIHRQPSARVVLPPPPSVHSSFETVGTAPAANIRTSPESSPFAAAPPPVVDGAFGAAPANRPGDSGRDERGRDTIRVLHNFDEAGGSYPYTDLVRDSAGNLYGMTVTGGDFGAGTVFQMSPSNMGWIHNVLYSFTGGLDGGQPYGGVTFNSQGNLYGTAVIGGTGLACEEGCGVVFELTPSGGTWSQRVIHNFQGGDDGAGAGGPVSFDNLGNLYGMTPIGGAFGIGTVFQLAPQPNGQWTKSTVHDFTGGEDGGAASSGRLLIDENRNIFGVATVGGANGVGTVFKIEPALAGTWTFNTLYAFKGQPNDGVFPYSGLVKDESGNLYGTTYYGGTNDAGVVYVLRPVGGAWKERVLYHFQDGSDGAGSVSTLIFGRNGRLYGTTTEGGASCDCGTIFELAPTANRFWEERVVHRFTGTPDGAYPYGGLVAGEGGKMYGATARGGADDDGMVYVFKP